MKRAEEGHEDLTTLARGPTGHEERIVPEVADPVNLAQHLRRYRLAMAHCADKAVLDLGTGAGYGANVLAQVASRLYAVDYDVRALRYCKRRYNRPNLSFLAANATALPIQSGTIEVAVSFEVIEHLPNHDEFLDEIRRVLRHDGCLIISTPNAETAALYREAAGFDNEAHISEVKLCDFRDELERYFERVELFGMSLRGSWAYRLLRALDPWNLRLRLFSGRWIQRARAHLCGVPSTEVSPDDVMVSRRHLRQANAFLAICQAKRS